jgi:hypothetical protein
MDWKSLGGSLIKAGAPIIGGALLGPLGSAIGGALGGIVADALGVEDTPEAVDAALQNTPADILQQKLALAESEAQAKWAALAEMAKADAEDRTAQSRAINKTVQMEIGVVSWYHWRHLLGYAVLAWVVCPLPIILYHMAVGKLDVLNGIVAALVSLIPLVGIAAALNGYVAGDTTRQKITAATGEAPPSATQTAAKAIKTVLGKKR